MVTRKPPPIPKLDEISLGDDNNLTRLEKEALEEDLDPMEEKIKSEVSYKYEVILK